MCTMICDMMRARQESLRVALGVALLSVMLLATGCAQPVEPDDAQMSTTPEQERSAPTQPAVRPQEAAVVDQPSAAVPATAAEQPEAPVETAIAPVHTASELMGKNQSEVTELMGAPSRVEQRAASTVWVYQGGDCGLDLYFFLDMATSDERVLTVAPSDESNTASAAAETAPSAGESAGEAQLAQTAESTVVDACYGKLRRS
jgi:hypothetical protein